MGTKIFEFESELPEVLYLDSSFIINFSIGGRLCSIFYFEDCAASINRAELYLFHENFSHTDGN